MSTLKGRKRLADENKIFDYSKFRYVTIRKIFDFLHGVDFEDVELSIGIEILAWTNFDGQVDQKSDTETLIFNEFSKQLKEKVLNTIFKYML